MNFFHEIEAKNQGIEKTSLSWDEETEKR